MNEPRNELNELQTQALLDLVSVIKDLVVVQGLAMKANGTAKLSSNERIRLEYTIQRNLK